MTASFRSTDCFGLSRVYSGDLTTGRFLDGDLVIKFRQIPDHQLGSTRIIGSAIPQPDN
jgi:hypothetical protein